MRIQNILECDGARRPRLAASIIAACVVGVLLLPLGRGNVMAVDGSEMSSAGTPQDFSDAAPVTIGNPLPGSRVPWRWGPGRDPWSGEEIIHRGIDVVARAGTPVLAPADGTVVVATEHFEPSLASGTVILIDHGNGWTTFYAHLGSLGVTEGQSVARGDEIATVGSTGKSTGPHLHFEIRRRDEPLDPADFIGDWKR